MAPLDVSSYMVGVFLLLLSFLQIGGLQSSTCSGRLLTSLEDVDKLRQERCCVIDGPLIVQYLPESPSNTSWRPSLNSIVKIKDFLLVQRLEKHYTDLSQLLPNLREIQGHRVIGKGKWAFVVVRNQHLRKLAPVEVRNGNVLITGNAYLCDNTSCILSNSTGRNIDNGLLTCSDVNCGHNSNRNVSEEVNNTCLPSEFETGLGSNCNGLRTVLKTSLNLDDQREEDVEARLDYVPTFSLNNECVTECPPGYLSDKELGVCQRCKENYCTHVCDSPEIIVTSHKQVRYLENCTMLVGNLKVSVKLRGTDEYYFHKYLKDVQRITGYLLVFSSTGLRDLSFLDSLVQIDGNHLWNDRYVVALYSNWHLAHLWDKVDDLIVGRSGNTSAAYIQFNPSLCEGDVRNLTEKFNRTEGNVGNSLTGICNFEELLLTVRNVSEESVTVGWKPSRLSSSRLIGGYIVHYVMIADLAEECTEDRQNEPCNRMISRLPQDFVGWNAIEWNQDTNYGTINNLIANTEYLIHIQSYSVAPHQHVQTSNVINVTTKKEAFASEPVQLRVVSCCSRSTDSDSLTGQWEATDSNKLAVQWDIPRKGNASVIGYVVELQLLKWDPCNTSALPKAAKWLSSQNLTRNISKSEICLPKCVVNDDHDQDIATDDYDVTIFQQLARFNYKKDGSTHQQNIVRGTYISKSVNSTSAVITKLWPFLAYKVRVQAQTEAGWGPWSREVIAFTAPSSNSDRVFNLSADVINATMVNITWSKPRAPNGNFVRSYCLEVRWSFDDGLRWEPPNLTLSSICDSVPDENGLVKLTLYDQRESQIVQLKVQDRPSVNTSVNFSVSVNSLFPWENQSSSFTHPIQSVSFTMPAKDSVSSTDRGLVIAVCVASVLSAVLLVAIVVAGVYVRRIKKIGKIRANSVNEVLTNFVHLSSSSSEGYEVDEWEVDCKDLTLGEVLGEGAFGTVYLGSLQKNNKEIKVAVKTLATGSSYSDRLLFLKEGSVMKKFSSDHVVRLLGIVSQNDPVLVIMELMSRGDLKQHLKSLRPEGAPIDVYNVDPMPLTIDELLQMAAEIAAGMAYFANRKFVHRDLAARNCMVAEDGRIKIGDFGLARDLYASDYYKKCGQGPVPVKWMAPEALRDGVFSQSSDVWSYGVVLWEIVTVGAEPYSVMTNEEVLRFVVAGNRIDLSSLRKAPMILVKLMEMCWQYRPSKRPVFADILAELPAVDGYEIMV